MSVTAGIVNKTSETVSLSISDDENTERSRHNGSIDTVFFIIGNGCRYHFFIFVTLSIVYVSVIICNIPNYSLLSGVSVITSFTYKTTGYRKVGDNYGTIGERTYNEQPLKTIVADNIKTHNDNNIFFILQFYSVKFKKFARSFHTVVTGSVFNGCKFNFALHFVGKATAQSRTGRKSRGALFRRRQTYNYRIL